MTSSPTDDRDDQDRSVSRRVDHATAATPSDERAYRAANPTDDDGGAPDDGGAGGAAERAERDLAPDDESEPVRSE